MDSENGNGKEGVDGEENEAQRERDQRSKALGAAESGRYECEACENHFCIDCDIFSHEQMHNCPGCLSKPVFQAAGEENGTNGTANGTNGH